MDRRNEAPARPARLPRAAVPSRTRQAVNVQPTRSLPRGSVGVRNERSWKARSQAGSPCACARRRCTCLINMIRKTPGFASGRCPAPASRPAATPHHYAPWPQCSLFEGAVALLGCALSRDPSAQRWWGSRASGSNLHEWQRYLLQRGLTTNCEHCLSPSMP